MAHKICIICVFIAVMSGLAFNPATNSKSGESAFGNGEKLVYKIFYNWNFVWLTAGEVHFEIKEEEDLFHIEVTGKTYASYEWFYKVRDKYHSYIDKTSGLPKLYIRDIQQGNYRRYEKVVFDYDKRMAYSYTGRTMSDLKLTEIPLDKPYYDMISCMYYLRSQDLQKFSTDKKTTFNILLDDEKYELGLKFKDYKKSFKIKDSGTYRIFHAVADVISGHVFDKDAKIKLYVGDDHNYLPVLIESPLVVGSVKAILSSCNNLKHPFDSKIE
ncbi:MAG: DUF3108 domain-containing protein [Saprospiraceae bacterium]|nr:DUF3108 domain-containing protein [Saprospiraceae bacterium]